MSAHSGLVQAKTRRLVIMLKKMLFVTLVPSLMSLASSGQSQPTGSITDVSGVWIMLIEGHQVGLELEQKDTTVKGVILIMAQRQLLEGTFEQRMLTLKREEPEEAPPTGHGGAFAGQITARMLDDGTLEGELTTSRGPTKWTGERLQKK